MPTTFSLAQLRPTTYEQRAPLYEDVEELLDHGFLAQSVTIGGVGVTLRSLSPNDQYTLRHRSYGTSGEEWRVWVVATATWIANGYDLLGEQHAVPRLAKAFRALPANVRQVLFNVVISLYDRVAKATEAIESYAYETVSRYKWRSNGGGLPAGLTAAGVGTNHVQRMWTFYNMVEDLRVADDNLWEGFKLSTSPHAPKGIKKIDDRDRQAKQMEKDRRQTVQDRFFYTVKGLVAPLTKGTAPQASKTQPMGLHPKSVDELAEEMRRWVAGEDDWHDTVVHDYKQTIVTNYEQHKRDSAERAAMLAALHEEESAAPRPLVAYTPQQLEEMLRDRGEGGHSGVRTVATGMNPVREHLFEKYLGREPDRGALATTEDGRVVVGTPSGDDGNTLLGDRIAERQVGFGHSTQEPEMEW